MGSGAIKWHVHCSVCGAFIEKSAQSDSEVECKKCRSTLEIFVNGCRWLCNRKESSTWQVLC